VRSNLDALIHRLDTVEARAYRDMIAAAPQALARTLGLETRDVAGATLLLAPGMPTAIFNRVIGLNNRHRTRETDLDAIMDLYRMAGIRNWWVHVSPGAHASRLTGQLVARGFVAPERGSWAKVLRGTEVPAPVQTDAEVRAVRPGEGAALAETICAAFDMPITLAPWFEALVEHSRWRAVAALLDGKIVGGGFLHVQGGDAWLGVGGVRPEARRLHAHRALMTLRIQQAIEAGCTQITTETGEAIGDEPNPSLRNMQACGFTIAYSRLNFATPG
jgi:GNAT superfamily N-acetyltransferase